MNKYLFSQALKITAPVFFGYVAIGIPFGLMITTANYPWWVAPLMSITMYAGAGQYVAIGLYAAGAPLAAIAITELFVNIRHIVYGLSLITKFRNVGKWKPFLIFALTDETYALLTGVQLPENTNPGNFYGIIALLDYLYWIFGGIIGAVAGTLMPISFKGVDFALTALFAVLLIGQLKATKNFLPAAIGTAVTLLAIILSRSGILNSQHILIAALAAGIAVLIMLRGHKTAGGVK